MTKVHLAHDAWVLVGDGRKALLLRNHGDAEYPNLRTSRVFQSAPNPSSSAQGSDRPGRSVDHASGRRSGMDEPDIHDLSEQRFVQGLAMQLSTLESQIEVLVVVAPPRALATLRAAFSNGLRKKIVAEVSKDLTHHPVHEIERILHGARQG